MKYLLNIALCIQHWLNSIYALWIQLEGEYIAIMQLPPRQNRDDLYAILNWFSED